MNQWTHSIYFAEFRDLSTKDPLCNLVAWQYVLTNQYQLKRCAEQIADLQKFLTDSYSAEGKSDTFNNILTFLLCLRNVPSIQQDQMVSDNRIFRTDQNTQKLCTGKLWINDKAYVNNYIDNQTVPEMVEWIGFDWNV